ncbi:uncharacterized protein EHS24_006425 [Apiotrichum porosum]|uniref:Transmembrane protein n=1 Tax=Apiotrichum porosum TaxID=105984 RepID=A0A427Y1D0_9TREE|nr:uncharacterized protein EHS24_006425 [Apiotrichum porosum]RSH84887.1 hypothetical protein EHS24_006425 [Apiotrichum porosum]
MTMTTTTSRRHTLRVLSPALALALLAAVTAAPVHPAPRDSANTTSISTGLSSPSSASPPTTATASVSAAAAASSTDSSSGGMSMSTMVGVFVPVFCGLIIFCFALYCLGWGAGRKYRYRLNDMYRNRHSTSASPGASGSSTPSTAAAAGGAATGAGGRRTRRARGDAPRRTESGRSVRTLPVYTKEAGDEETVLLRRDPSARRRAEDRDSDSDSFASGDEEGIHLMPTLMEGDETSTSLRTVPSNLAPLTVNGSTATLGHAHAHGYGHAHRPSEADITDLTGMPGLALAERAWDEPPYFEPDFNVYLGDPQAHPPSWDTVQNEVRRDGAARSMDVARGVIGGGGDSGVAVVVPEASAAVVPETVAASAEPGAEPTAESTAEATAEPAAEPAAQSAAEPAAEPPSTVPAAPGPDVELMDLAAEPAVVLMDMLPSPATPVAPVETGAEAEAEAQAPAETGSTSATATPVSSSTASAPSPTTP